MTRKKVFIGLGLVVLVGAMIWANFAFKKTGGAVGHRRGDQGPQARVDRLRVREDPRPPHGQHHLRGVRQGGEAGRRGGRPGEAGPVPAPGGPAQRAQPAAGQRGLARAAADRAAAGAPEPRERQGEPEAGAGRTGAAAAARPRQAGHQAGARTGAGQRDAAARATSGTPNRPSSTAEQRIKSQMADLRVGAARPQPRHDRVADRRHRHQAERRRGRDGGRRASRTTRASCC